MACTCNVGDSLAYVYSPSQGHVREITQGSHDIQSNRDMRDALGKKTDGYLEFRLWIRTYGNYNYFRCFGTSGWC